LRGAREWPVWPRSHCADLDRLAFKRSRGRPTRSTHDYGLLAEQGADFVWSLLDALIRAGCLEISSGQYPTLSLTELGRDVMLKKKTIPLAIPEMLKKSPKSGLLRKSQSRMRL